MRLSSVVNLPSHASTFSGVTASSASSRFFNRGDFSLDRRPFLELFRRWQFQRRLIDAIKEGK